MATVTHQRSIHIDAPVEKVFDFVKDPHNMLDVMSRAPGSRLTGHMKAEPADVSMTPDRGVGSTWSFRGALFIYHFTATFTREEFVANERIADRNPDVGSTWTSTFEPDETGTTMSLKFGYPAKMALVGKAEDVIFWDGDRDLDAMLGEFKKAIEA